MKRININKSQVKLFLENKLNPMNEPYVMITKINNGDYDSDIIYRMINRKGKEKVYKWINHRNFDDYWKQQVCDLIFERYAYLKTKKMNTDIVCKAINDGVFDEDIANKEYSWFNEQTDIFIGVLKKVIEERIKKGKTLGLFRGLPSKLGYNDVPYNNDDDYNYFLLKDAVKITRF